jgi:hypothetical protein
MCDRDALKRRDRDLGAALLELLAGIVASA